jgi:hypothetical protein
VTANGEPGTPDASGASAEDIPGVDTTVRRPRVPAPPDPVALAAADHADDTVIVRRISHPRKTAAGSPGPTPIAVAGAVVAFPSRVAAPVRGSRKGHPEAIRERAEGGQRTIHDPIPDASGIRRSLRTRARRRLVTLVATIIALVAVLLVALVALVFAAGV